MGSISVVDKAGEANAVAVNVARTFRSIYENEKEYNVQSVVPVNVVSPKRKLCTATFGASDTIVNAATPDTGNVNLIVEDGVTKLVFAPFIAADQTVFPDAITIALFDVDTAQVNEAPQFLGAMSSAKKLQETEGVCYYEPVVFDNIFMTNKVAVKVKLATAPGAALVISLGAFVGGDAVLPLPTDGYWASVSLLVQPAEDAEQDSSSIYEYKGESLTLSDGVIVDLALSEPAMKFPSTASRIVIPHRSEFNLPTGDFTIDGWFISPATTAFKHLCGHRQNDANVRGWSIYAGNSRLFFAFHVDDEFAYPQDYTVSSQNNMTTSTLYYFMVKRDAGDYVTKINAGSGFSAGTVVTPGYEIYPNTDPLVVGAKSAYHYSSETWSPGSIISLRITNGIVRPDALPASHLFPPRGA